MTPKAASFDRFWFLIPKQQQAKQKQVACKVSRSQAKNIKKKLVISTQ